MNSKEKTTLGINQNTLLIACMFMFACLLMLVPILTKPGVRYDEKCDAIMYLMVKGSKQDFSDAIAEAIKILPEIEAKGDLASFISRLESFCDPASGNEPKRVKIISHFLEEVRRVYMNSNLDANKRKLSR